MVPGQQLCFPAPRSLLTPQLVSLPGLANHPPPLAPQLSKFCPVLFSSGQPVSITGKAANQPLLHWAERPGAFAGTCGLGAAGATEITLAAASAANVLALSTGTDTHISPHAGTRTSVEPLLPNRGRTGTATVPGRQTLCTWGSELCSHFL